MASLVNEIFGPLLERLPENNRLERIWILAKVDFKKRYYESGLGLLWALINPLMRLAVYTLAFQFIRTSKFENFSLYLFSGLLVWLFFTELAGKGLTLVKQKKYLFESIQFNWVDVFIGSGLSALIGFLFNFSAYFIMSFIVGIYPGIYVLWLPLLILNILITASAFSILMASINVYLKDINHLWSIIVLAGFWTAPIFFPLESLIEKAPILPWIHPTTPIIVNIRNILFYNQNIDVIYFAWGWLYGFIALIISYLFFRKASVDAVEKS